MVENIFVSQFERSFWRIVVHYFVLDYRIKLFCKEKVQKLFVLIRITMLMMNSELFRIVYANLVNELIIMFDSLCIFTYISVTGPLLGIGRRAVTASPGYRVPTEGGWWPGTSNLTLILFFSFSPHLFVTFSRHNPDPWIQLHGLQRWASVWKHFYCWWREINLKGESWRGWKRRQLCVEENQFRVEKRRESTNRRVRRDGVNFFIHCCNFVERKRPTREPGRLRGGGGDLREMFSPPELDERGRRASGRIRARRRRERRRASEA